MNASISTSDPLCSINQSGGRSTSTRGAAPASPRFVWRLRALQDQNTPQSGMSHHLRILSDANLVERRKEGTSIFYRRTTKTPQAALEPLTQTLFQTIDQMPLSLRAKRERKRCMRSVVVVQRHSSKRTMIDSKTTKKLLPNSPNTASVFQISSILEIGIQRRPR